MLTATCGCSFRGDQSSRPPHVASQMGALAWGLDMANFENVPVALNGFEMAEVSMLWSVFMREVWLRIQVSALSRATPVADPFAQALRQHGTPKSHCSTHAANQAPLSTYTTSP